MEEKHPGPGNTLIRAYSTKPAEYVDEANHLLFLNYDYQFSLAGEELYHEYFAHIPIMALGRVPWRVLVLGAGDGLLIRELLKYKEIGQIVHVELDPVMDELSATNPILSHHNRGALRDPRVETRYEDAYAFARYADEKFDCVYIDFPMAADYNLSKLYSREFYVFVARLIHDDGFIVLDSPGIGLLTVPDAGGTQMMIQGNDWPVYYNTFRAAGYLQIIPYLTTLEVDPQGVADRLAAQGIPLSVEGSTADLLAAVETPEERDTILRVAFRRTLQAHVANYQQGFIMLARKRGVLHPRWVDNGIELYILTEDRFHRAFGLGFPTSPKVVPELVNSILRPVFPTLPIWDARVPY
jgi:spermidine synthase